MKRLRIRITGLVQGVGFRYFARRCAESSGVTGFVSNCYDGSVLAECQGDEVRTDEFISMLRRGPSRSAIGSFTIEEIGLISEESGFRIR